MSFAKSMQNFATQAARSLQAVNRVSVQPYTGAGYADVDGDPVSVFLSAWKVERTLGETGFILETKAQLRVLKTCRWVPAEGKEAVDLRTDTRFRCNTATGADDAHAAEIVCEVVKL